MIVFKKIRHFYFKVVGFFLAGNPDVKDYSNGGAADLPQFEPVLTSTFYE